MPRLALLIIWMELPGGPWHMPRLALRKIWKERPGGPMVSSMYHPALSGGRPPKIGLATNLAHAGFGGLCSTRGRGLTLSTVTTSSSVGTS